MPQCAGYADWTAQRAIPTLDAVDAARITRRSKSNLALAFVSLGRERRRDITTFYAFCRVIDDIADSPESEHCGKSAGTGQLAQLDPDAGSAEDAACRRAAKAHGKICPRAGNARRNHRRRGDGFAHRSAIATFAELRVYCYRVASAVGLVSIEIFGYRNPQCREYAIELGLALQTTNIIRDVGKDLRSDRIYLPQDEMARFDYSEADLRARTHDAHFLQLMDFQARARARLFRQGRGVASIARTGARWSRRRS